MASTADITLTEDVVEQVAELAGGKALVGEYLIRRIKITN
jgi:hypothetical protein